MAAGHIQILEENFRFGHLAGAYISAGQPPAGGSGDGKAVSLQCGKIVLGDGVLVHFGIHCRRYDLGCFAGQDGGGQHVVRNAVGQLGDHIGGSRSHQDGVRRLGQGNVLHLEFKIPVKGIGDTFVPGKGLEGDGVDKVHGVLRHDHPDVRSCFYKHAGKGGAFVGGDPAGHSKKNGFIF